MFMKDSSVNKKANLVEMLFNFKKLLLFCYMKGGNKITWKGILIEIDRLTYCPVNTALPHLLNRIKALSFVSCLEWGGGGLVPSSEELRTPFLTLYH